jgi:hypothetical protein
MKLLKTLLFVALFSISFTSCTELDDDDTNQNIENKQSTGDDETIPDGGKD